MNNTDYRKGDWIVGSWAAQATLAQVTEVLPTALRVRLANINSPAVMLRKSARHATEAEIHAVVAV